MMAKLKPHMEVNPESGSVHIVLVMPLEWDEEWERARPGKWQLSKVQGFIAWLLEKLAYQYPDEDWNRLEIFGRNQHDYALPLSGTYKMFIDRPLDKVQGYYQDYRHQRTSCQTQDIVAYMNWLVDPEAKSCAWDAAIKEVRQIVRNRLDQEEVQHAPAKERKSVRPGAMARVEWQGRFLQNIIDFRTGNLPEDSLGCYATPIRRYLAVACGKDQELFDDLFKLIFEEHERKGLLSYSDRLANNPQEFWRSEAFLKKKIEAGNLYQQDPEKSTEKLQAVKAHYDGKGIDIWSYLLTGDLQHLQPKFAKTKRMQVSWSSEQLDDLQDSAQKMGWNGEAMRCAVEVCLNWVCSHDGELGLMIMRRICAGYGVKLGNKDQQVLFRRLLERHFLTKIKGHWHNPEGKGHGSIFVVKSSVSVIKEEERGGQSHEIDTKVVSIPYPSPGSGEAQWEACAQVDWGPVILEFWRLKARERHCQRRWQYAA